MVASGVRDWNRFNPSLSEEVFVRLRALKTTRDQTWRDLLEWGLPHLEAADKAEKAAREADERRWGTRPGR
jgi:hypothetical protein